MNADRPLRVVHVIQGLQYGGAEQSVIDLLAALDRDYVTPILITVYGPEPRSLAVHKLGVPLFDMAKRPGLDPWCLWRMVKLLRRLRPDIVHTHTFSGSTYGRVAARLARVPILIHTEHSAAASNAYYAGVGLLFRLLGRWTDATVVFGERTRDALLARSHARSKTLTLIPNGVPSREPLPEDMRAVARKALGVEPEECFFLAAGGLRSQKGYDLMIEAAKLLQQRAPQLRFRLWIVGSGPLQNELENMTQRLGVNTVVFAGERGDVRTLLRAVDVFLNTSVWESMPVAVLEAMAAGVPVIVPPVGDLPAMLQAGGGIVVDRSPEAFADAMAALGLDPGRRLREGAAGRFAVKMRFSITSTARRHEELYRSLMQRGRWRDRSQRNSQTAPNATSGPVDRINTQAQ